MDFIFHKHFSMGLLWQQGRHNPVSGFTLIELLVVTGIIGILTTMSVASLTGVREKVNDARRVSDVRQLSSLIQHEDITLSAPVNIQGCDGSAADKTLTTACTGPSGISEFSKFKDPARLTGDTPCSRNSAITCGYGITKNDGSRQGATNNYQICFYLEEGIAGMTKGLNSIINGGTFRTGCQ